ncbi:MAG: DUF3471 domain-containing protein [Bacteroidetes bacterium]|nr:MAG: DUF3471 domain-containing protein [Bacteroidota bacterium]
MKKFLLLVVTVCAFGFVNAQTPSPADSLKEYTGKYKFPDGSPFSEVNITLENGVLTASSAAGSSELKRRDGDVFDVVAYSGTAIFKRNDDKKVTKLQIQVNDLDMEGEKAAEGSLSDIFWRYKK